MVRNEGPPDWMQERESERESRGHRQQPAAYIKSDISQVRRQWSPTPDLGRKDDAGEMEFPQSVITGVKIIAGLMLLNTWFAFSFGMVSLFEPAGTEMQDSFSGRTYSEVSISDYFSFWRVFISGIIAIALSAITWKVVSDS